VFPLNKGCTCTLNALKSEWDVNKRSSTIFLKTPCPEYQRTLTSEMNSGEVFLTYILLLVHQNSFQRHIKCIMY